MIRVALVLSLLVLTTRAHAQSPTAQPLIADDATCRTLDLTPGALLDPPVATGAIAPSIPWSEFAVLGEMIGADNSGTVHALFAPTLSKFQTTLSEDKWPEIAKLTATFGYQLVSHHLNGQTLVLEIAPLPVVRKVDVHVRQSLKGIFRKLIDEEIRRRMRLRVGTYLPWDTLRRQCALLYERQRIRDYLIDEGYFEASVSIPSPAAEHGAATLKVTVDQGPEYQIGRVRIARQGNVDPAQTEPLAIRESEIKAVFSDESCFLGLCVGGRFTRTKHQEDLQKVRDMFHQRGYPAARVQSSLDLTSYDRRTKRVNVTITIDQRRHVFVDFLGNDPDAVPTEKLRQQLTFDQAGSADDFEAGLSAKALATYLQKRGYFDARVTWSRDRRETGPTGFDRITFWIDMGKQRSVHAVEFIGNTAIKRETLEDVVSTKQPEKSVAAAIFGADNAATSEQLSADIERIKETYRRQGYRDARVSVKASVDDVALGKPALTAPLVEAGLGGDLRVHFDIEEGKPTLLTRIELVHMDTDKVVRDATCEQILKELSSELAPPKLEGTPPPGQREDSTALAKRITGSGCAAEARYLVLREPSVAATRDKLREWLFRNGRTRSEVEVELCSAAGPAGECTPLQPSDLAAVVRYKLRHLRPLTIGKVVVRDNFKTKTFVIKGELERAGLREGKPLTTQALADGARYLRNTGLFNAVNIELPDLADNNSPVVNAVVRVEERYDYRAEVNLEVGYSSYNNGYFGTIIWKQLNLFGRGISFTANYTEGTKITNLEGTLRIPQLLIDHLFDIELNLLYRKQDTVRFGVLTTKGATVAIADRHPHPRKSNDDPAHSWGWSLHYDYRVRNRQIPAVRPIGADDDNSEVAISTTTGSIGATADWEQRDDLSGQPAPFAPQAGFRLEASAAVAAPALSFNTGSDTFVKISASGSKWYSLRENIVLRGDLRLDEGFPLGGAVLLPEVERYFAGGDGTVRGYEDDKLATEIQVVGVPPISNLTQIRVSPAGGNIRMLASLDAQVRIVSVLAGAVFSDAGMITNQWSTVTTDDIRPSVGMGLRAVTAFGIAAVEYAVPLRLQLGDDPRGRFHVYFAARTQF